MRTIHKMLLSSAVLAVVLIGGATTSAAQSDQQKSTSDLSMQNTQSLIAFSAERTRSGATFFRTPETGAASDKQTFVMPNMTSWITPKTGDWDALSDDAKKAFGQQLGRSALRWADNAEVTSTDAGKAKATGPVVFVNRGPQPFQLRQPQN
jgi:hypothetical protein